MRDQTFLGIWIDLGSFLFLAFGSISAAALIQWGDGELDEEMDDGVSVWARYVENAKRQSGCES